MDLTEVASIAIRIAEDSEPLVFTLSDKLDPRDWIRHNFDGTESYFYTNSMLYILLCAVSSGNIVDIVWKDK